MDGADREGNRGPPRAVPTTSVSPPAIVLTDWLFTFGGGPAQRVMFRAAPGESSMLTRAYHRGNITGWAATVPLLYALWCMVAKPRS